MSRGTDEFLGLVWFAAIILVPICIALYMGVVSDERHEMEIKYEISKIGEEKYCIDTYWNSEEKYISAICLKYFK